MLRPYNWIPPFAAKPRFKLLSLHACRSELCENMSALC